MRNILIEKIDVKMVKKKGYRFNERWKKKSEIYNKDTYNKTKREFKGYRKK